MTDQQPAIRLTGLTKEFGAVTAVDHVDLEIAAGEFFSMLGPSGSGKTTVLRLIAGFEQPTSGTIELFGQDVTEARAVRPRRQHGLPGLRAVPAHERARQRRLRAAGARHRAQGAATTGPCGRSPRCGSSRWRRASPRSCRAASGSASRSPAPPSSQPKVLLLDEPLGALDLKLREQMQVELKEIQRDLGITFIFVTHDQEEALTLSDRIAVFNDGRIEQLGTPAELYERPGSRFVADFVGTSNLFDDERSRSSSAATGTTRCAPRR